MRTILYCLTIGGTFIYGMIFRYPFTFFMNEEQKKRYVEKIAVRWARNCMWAAGSKVELVYKNKASIDEIIKNGIFECFATLGTGRNVGKVIKYEKAGEVYA